MSNSCADTNRIVDYVDLEALDISKLDEPGGKQALVDQLLSFINKNGIPAPVHVQVPLILLPTDLLFRNVSKNYKLRFTTP